MTRKECLDKAAECVLKDRQNAYGKPEDCFGMIAGMWGAYLGVCVSAHDVAAMMALLKIARFRHNPSHEDNAVDCAGYAACMVECATAWEREGEDEAEGGCCQNGNDQPEFKRGDSLLVTMPDGEDIRCIYVGESTHPGCCCVRYLGGDFSGDTDDTVPTDQLRRVPAPKAEGCEALVEKDAPQTAQELYDRILSCNPATYGTPHKPTGEELAEMAEEDAHE